MLNRSIAYRLSIYISLAVISVFVAFIAVYFMFSLGVIKDNIQHKAVNLSSNVTGIVRRYVMTTKELSSNIAEQIIFYDQHRAVDPFINGILKKYPFINSIYIHVDSTVVDVEYHAVHAFRSNQNVIVTTDDDVRLNNFGFESGKNFFKQGWSEPFMCKNNGNVVVSYYIPIKKDGKKIGGVLCELSLLDLNESVNRIKIGKEGFAFLLSQTGTYITHPMNGWIMKRNIFNLAEASDRKDVGELKSMIYSRTSGNFVARPDYLKNKKSWVYYTPLNETGWTLFFIMPYDELFEPLYIPILKMLFFSVVGILIIYLLITYITNKEIHPLSSVANQLKRFTSLTGESAGKSSTMNEIEQVSDSLKDMRLWYEKYKISLSKEERKNKLQHEDLLQASEIQQSLIKVDFPVFTERDDLDIYAAYRPMRVVSGDLFDYFFRNEDDLVFTMGDVSGKGVPAAFFMSVAQTIVKTSAEGSTNGANDIVYRANQELHTNNLHQFFLTLFLGVLNMKTGKLTFCNAAHNTTYIVKADGSVQRLLETHGLPLGLYRGKKYRQGSYQLEEGDSVVLYTDGVTELQDENRVQFGHERLMGVLEQMQGLSPKEMVDGLEDRLKAFLGEAPQNDDISIMVLRYKA